MRNSDFSCCSVQQTHPPQLQSDFYIRNMIIAAMKIFGWLLIIHLGSVYSEYCNPCKTPECSTCIVGWYDENCTSFCSENCLNGCNKTGWCSDCKPNYFGGKCGERCPKNCRSSDRDDVACDQISAKCLSGCVEGSWGPTCNYSCPFGCVRNVCIQTTGECTMGCNNGLEWNKSKQKCTTDPPYVLRLHAEVRAEVRTCRDGFYGKDCDLPCSLACRESSCDFKPSQNSLVCKRGCIDGRTGPYCEQLCQKDCLRCSETGWCETQPSTGCQYACTTPACSSCFDGYYGLNCEKKCPENCKDVCYKANGSCNYACKDGFWSPYCNLICPPNCRGSACEQSTGECTGGCQPGWYGVKCNITCPKGCFPNICYQATGECTKACTIGYSGDRCDRRCAGKCETCDRRNSSHCTKCTCQTYGPNCDHKCSSGCLDTVCPVCSTQRVCLDGCKRGRWGDRCDHECPSKCGQCDQQSGDCGESNDTDITAFLPLIFVTVMLVVLPVVIVFWDRFKE